MRLINKQDIHQQVEKLFPKTASILIEQNLIGDTVFSPYHLSLPQDLLNTIQSFVRSIEDLKNSQHYQSQLPHQYDWMSWPENPGVLNCFDFHYTERGGLKLIEINTNASLFLPTALVWEAQRSGEGVKILDDLYQSFQQAFHLSEGHEEFTIVDVDPPKEAMYFEFLLYKEWLEQHGHPTTVLRRDQLKETSSLKIYNRLTDFYLEDSANEFLLSDYKTGRRTLAPNPRDYFLLADKKRLDLMRHELLKTSPDRATIIPETRLFSEFEGPEDIWSQRKKLFFKPGQAFGGKGAFAGKSISRKLFDEIYDPHFIAQEFCPAGRITFEEGTVEMKFDLRVFAFAGQVQTLAARLYQGQTTNMRTPGGGLALVRFS